MEFVEFEEFRQIPKRTRILDATVRNDIRIDNGKGQRTESRAKRGKATDAVSDEERQ